MNNFKVQANTDSVDTRSECLGISAWLEGDSTKQLNSNRGLHIQIRHNKDPHIYAAAHELQQRIVKCLRVCEGIEDLSALDDLLNGLCQIDPLEADEINGSDLISWLTETYSRLGGQSAVAK